MSNIQNSFTKILQSRVSREDMLKNPEIKKALESDKLMRLDFLSAVKLNLVDTNGFKNEKNKNIIEDMNTFRKIYYNDYNANKLQLEKIYKISNENNLFLNQFSEFNKYYNNENQKEILNNIQLEYKKKNGFAPIIKENGNLFTGSILLQNEKDLKQYISLDMDTIKKDKNSLSFMKNIRNKIKLNNSKDNKNVENIGNQEIAKFNDNDTENEDIKRKDEKKKSLKIEKGIYEDIKDLKKEIIKTTESFNSIDNLNYFLNTNNQQHLNYIGNMSSRQSSGQASTRINSGMHKFKDLKLNEEINNILEPIKKNNTKQNLYRMHNYAQKIYKANNTFDNIKSENNKKNKNYNSVILPYININKSFINNTQVENNEDINKNKNRKKTLDYIKITESKNSNNNIQDKNESIKNIKRNFKPISKKKISNKSRKRMLLKKNSTNLENLYEKLSKSDNSIKYNKEIKYYLKKNKFEINDKFNDNDLYKSIDKSRRKITDTNSIEKNYDLMINNKLKTFEQKNNIIQYNNKIKRKMEDIEERMFKISCNVNKYNDN